MRSCTLFFALSLAACNNQASTISPEAVGIVGPWEWTAACCSIAGAELTPATEGYAYVLSFAPDGTVQAVRDNDIVQNTRYTITRSRPSPTADEITLIHYDAPLPHGPSIPPAQTQMLQLRENGALSLINPDCADCYGEWRFLPRLQ